MLVGPVGCGVESEYGGMAPRNSKSRIALAPTDAAYPAPMAKSEDRSSGGMSMMMGGGQAPHAPGSPAGEAPAPAPPALPRKIIYNADIALIIEDFSRTEPEIQKLVEAGGGYIAEQRVLGSPGAQRSALWKVRVPVDSFEQFVRAIARLGELEKNERNTQDVSERYYDLEARIKNKKVEEDRLLKILAESTGKLEDILKIEGELSRVRGEIEQMQGAIRVLENLTSLTTVTISVKERKDYTPPPPVAPTFAMMVARTFQDSVEKLVNVGKAIVLFVVAVAPWLPIVLLVALIVLVITRRAIRPWLAPRPVP
jgi:hypothetical protein